MFSQSFQKNTEKMQVYSRIHLRHEPTLSVPCTFVKVIYMASTCPPDSRSEERDANLLLKTSSHIIPGFFATKTSLSYMHSTVVPKALLQKYVMIIINSIIIVHICFHICFCCDFIIQIKNVNNMHAVWLCLCVLYTHLL